MITIMNNMQQNAFQAINVAEFPRALEQVLELVLCFIKNESSQGSGKLE